MSLIFGRRGGCATSRLDQKVEVGSWGAVPADEYTRTKQMADDETTTRIDRAPCF